MCLENGRSGGLSAVANSVRIHNQLVAERPDLAAALYDDVPLRLPRRALTRKPWVTPALWLILVFVCAYAVATTRTALFDPSALAQDLPSGKEVFGAGSSAHRLPQLISIPSYLILVGGAIWSAWRMRGRPELRDRFMGTLWIAIGATVIAGVGSAFAAAGNLPVFSLSLLVGIATMYWGFLRASRSRAPAATAT